MLSGQAFSFNTYYLPNSDLGTALTGIGVMTDSVQVQAAPAGTYSPRTGSDFQSLENEFLSLGSKSGVTVADLTNLDFDLAAIGQGWTSVTGQGLWSAVSELASAVAGGTSTTQAQTDWSALFSGSGVAQQVVDQTFNDLVQTIQDSHVTTTDLATVAGDETAFNNDLNMQSGADLDNQQRFDAEGVLDQGYGYMVSTPGGGVFRPTLSNLGVLTDYTPDSLNPIGVVTAWPGGESSPLDSDEQTLLSEFDSVAEKSGLTVVDMSNLNSDDQAITQLFFSGNGVNYDGLQNAVSELASAVAGGASMAQAHTDFNASFSSNMPQSVVDKAFDDLVQAIEDSHVTTADLSAVASDEAAVQSDPSAILGLHPPLVATSSFGSANTQAPGGDGSVGASGTDTNAVATTSSGGAPVVASKSTPSIVIVANSKGKDKTSHKATANAVAHAENHRSKLINRGQEAKKHTLAVRHSSI